MVSIKEYVMNMPDEYVSVSTRLPKIDANLLNHLCKKQGTTPSKYIRELIKKNIDSPQKKFLAGENRILYNKTKNAFSWFVQLDSGKRVLILDDVSEDFIKNLQQEIQEAIKIRNLWVHQSKPDSVDIPGELVGVGKNE